MKIQKKNIFFFAGGGLVGSRGSRVGGQGGCERRSKVFVKIKKKKKIEGGGVGRGRGGVQSGVRVGVARFGVGGGYGGCKPRIKGIDKCI